MDSESKLKGRGLIVAFGVVLGALVIYMGVSRTATEAPSKAALENIPVPDSITFSDWTSETWEVAQSKPSLVFFFVSDEFSAWSDSTLAVLNSRYDLRAVITRRYVPIRIDRRLRPDLAERYSEGRAPFLSILLPTGEALARMDGEVDLWPEQLLEADRYWHDHREEVQDRVDAFWEEIEADTASRTPREPVDLDRAFITDAIDSYVTSIVDKVTPIDELWRPDICRFLSSTEIANSDTLNGRFNRLLALRLTESSLHGKELIGFTSPAGYAAEALVWEFANISSAMRARRLEATFEFLATIPEMTSEEAALTATLAHLINADVIDTGSGQWLGSKDGSEASLPHSDMEPRQLDGYLLDAIAWLECYLWTRPNLLQNAERLADSMWANLWNSKQHAFRDKPQRLTPVREKNVYPRAQSGRVAYLFDLLAKRTGDMRWRHRADSCLAGFAPFAAEAGASAAYYGWALLMRSQPDGHSGFPSTRQKYER